jgi:hypothetical protein
MGLEYESPDSRQGPDLVSVLSSASRSACVNGFGMKALYECARFLSARASRTYPEMNKVRTSPWSRPDGPVQLFNQDENGPYNSVCSIQTPLAKKPSPSIPTTLAWIREWRELSGGITGFQV